MPEEKKTKLVAPRKFAVSDRGYTGHEHLLGVGLVHMNGRLYDPIVHRFLMPDNFVQDPYSTQSYNRYGYVLNNPLLYSDPSGEIIPLLIIGAALVGAYMGGAQANGTWNPLKWIYKSSSTWIGMAGGAAIGIATAGIGIAVTAAITPALASLGITGGILGGAITGIATGTAAGAFSGGFSNILPGGSGNFWGGVVKGAIMGAITGGILGASIGGLMTPKGHNVWTGAAPRAAVAPVSTIQATGVSTIDDAASIKTEVLTSKIASPAPSTSPSVAPAPTTPIKDGMGVVEVNIRPVQNPLDLVNVETNNFGIANSRALGLQGESAVGVGTKTRIPSLTNTAAYRVPDHLSSTALGEIKNVSHLSLTRQLRDFHLFSQQNGLQFNLFTRSTTTFSQPLQNLINNGSIIVQPIPFK
ncbi:putative toxin [Gelidibacter salicanalis]|uniref:putative toxin n=1 Tax=Gelidibacter salicanalis TaxID=291193 RepID=UPI0027DC5794|nr:putative toxin [Gelidibacter salicanalis]